MDTKTNLGFVLCALFLYLFWTTKTCLGADTISADQSLSGDETIVSAGEVFELGFFRPGKSSNYYIGMWYKQVSPQTVVWVANREKPVSDRFSSELKISDGNLVLFNEFKIAIWSTDVNSTNVASVQAVLHDNGNLVLDDGSNSMEPLWQSFDNPAHTWLPGGKISYNKLTKKQRRLTSWKNSEDPAPGLFSFELVVSDNSCIILWNMSRKYFTSGSWNGKIFSLVPEMNRNYIYDFDFISNDNESYFNYSVYNTSVIKITRSVMDFSGQIKQLTWLPTTGWNLLLSLPRQQCEVYGFCGAYGSCNENSLPFCRCLTGFKPKVQSNWDLKEYSDGCWRTTDLKCGNNSVSNGESDKFLPMYSMKLPENQRSVQAGSLGDCESSCLSDCSCTAYAYDNGDCSIWTGDLFNLKQLAADDSSGKTLYVRLAASELRSPKDNKGTIIGVVVGSVAAVAVFLGVIVFLIWRRKKRIGTGKAMEGSLVAFTYRDLQNATKNFSDKLGGGGFGSVFKGRLADSSVVAVKKLESVSQGEKQFRTEVSTIGTIQHVNLVRLRGFCSEGTRKLLVYDYMLNGSLASHLFHKNNPNVLDWSTRHQIALGIARGLVYLHENCRECIIHCDIKPENILLDAEFAPKLADFGLAKLLGREFSRVLTTIRGTRGYLAPEWIAGAAITSKADVYSFGMMLFELVSGRRNSEETESDGKLKYYPSMAISILVKGGDVLSLLDARLEGNADIEEVERMCKVACWCIQEDEARRPLMSQIVQILERIIEVSVPPVPRYLHFFDEKKETPNFYTEASSSQSSQAWRNTSTASSQGKITST